jgi:hypothetical protein
MKAKPPSQKPGVEVIPAAPLWAGTRGGRGSVTKGRKGVRLLDFTGQECCGKQQGKQSHRDHFYRKQKFIMLVDSGKMFSQSSEP